MSAFISPKPNINGLKYNTDEKNERLISKKIKENITIIVKFHGGKSIHQNLADDIGKHTGRNA